MSFDIDRNINKAIQTSKDCETLEHVVDRILGYCIAEDILSITCEGKMKWDYVERHIVKDMIKERYLNSPSTKDNVK